MLALGKIANTKQVKMAPVFLINNRKMSKHWYNSLIHHGCCISYSYAMNY